MGNDKTHLKSRQTPLQESASGLIHSVACSTRRPRGRDFIVVEHLTALVLIILHAVECLTEYAREEMILTCNINLLQDTNYDCLSEALR